MEINCQVGTNEGFQDYARALKAVAIREAKRVIFIYNGISCTLYGNTNILELYAAFRQAEPGEIIEIKNPEFIPTPIKPEKTKVEPLKPRKCMPYDYVAYAEVWSKYIAEGLEAGKNLQESAKIGLEKLSFLELNVNQFSGMLFILYEFWPLGKELVKLKRL